MVKKILIIVAVLLLLAVVILGGIAWSIGIHFWDDSQLPIITVSNGLRPTITFEPEQAYTLTVYEGSENKDGLDVLWSARGSSAYENDLSSPVVYGVPPAGSDGQTAEPLIAGQTYTVVIFRKDPKGGGDGFLNTRHRYEGMLTFTAVGE